MEALGIILLMILVVGGVLALAIGIIIWAMRWGLRNKDQHDQ